MPEWLVEKAKETNDPELMEMVLDILLVVNVWIIEIITQNPNLDVTEDELLDSLFSTIVSDLYV